MEDTATFEFYIRLVMVKMNIEELNSDKWIRGGNNNNNSIQKDKMLIEFVTKHLFALNTQKCQNLIITIMVFY